MNNIHVTKYSPRLGRKFLGKFFTSFWYGNKYLREGEARREEKKERGKVGRAKRREKVGEEAGKVGKFV